MNFLNLKENYTTHVIYSSKKDVPSKTPDQIIPNRNSLLKKSILTFGLVGICFFSIENLTFASDFNAKAEALYYSKFMSIAKLIIVFKGGWDILNNALKENFDMVKKCMLQYSLVFASLLLLPTVLNSVEDFIKE